MIELSETVKSLLTEIDKQKAILGNSLKKLKKLQDQCCHPDWVLVNEDYYGGGWDYAPSIVRTYECKICKSQKRIES